MKCMANIVTVRFAGGCMPEIKQVTTVHKLRAVEKQNAFVPFDPDNKDLPSCIRPFTYDSELIGYKVQPRHELSAATAVQDFCLYYRPDGS
jgi:hypothetical protein